MGRGKGGGTVQSGPGANVNLAGIDRSKRNLNTGEKWGVMIGIRVVWAASSQSFAQRNGLERGIREARTWKSEVVVAGREEG